MKKANPSDRGAGAGPAPAVLFDLDGTLVDSAPGILEALRRAFVEAGVPLLGPDDEKAVLGPPLQDFLAQKVGADRAADMVTAYRRHYADTCASATPYDGIVRALRDLQAQGHVLAVCTSKLESIAETVLGQAGLRPFFATVCGEDAARSRSTKALVIAECLERLGLPASGAVMIGDRNHDILGAAHHAMAAIGVGWGYGSRRELEEAGAETIAGDVPAMLEAIAALRR